MGRMTAHGIMGEQEASKALVLDGQILLSKGAKQCASGELIHYTLCPSASLTVNPTEYI